MPRTAADLDQTLLELITNERIADQFELQEALKRAGKIVSQPTLSRHLTRLGITTGPLAAIASIDLGDLGYLVVGLFLFAWLAAVGVWKFAGLERRWG